MTTYLYNVQTQRELEQDIMIPFSQRSLEERLLQYLPALFSHPDDSIYVDELPSKAYLDHLHNKGFNPGTFALLPKLAKLQEASKLKLWCFSPSGTSFLKKGEYPDWQVVKKANSKVELLTLWNKPPIGIKIETEKDLLEGLEKTLFPCILKAEYGFSARNNLLITKENFDQVKSSILSQLAKSRRFVLEPRLERVYDFSSQWLLKSSYTPELLGTTFCINDKNGRYLASIALPKDHSFLKSSIFTEHLQAANPALQALTEKGYFGPIGIDAFAYVEKSKSESLLVHPLVEINARQTMGSVALSIQRRYHQNDLLKVQFEKNLEEGLLPKIGTPFNLEMILDQAKIDIPKFADNLGHLHP